MIIVIYSSEYKNIVWLCELKKPDGREIKRGRLENTGIFLGFLGGVVAISQSGIVVAYSIMRDQFGRYGLVGFGVAVFVLGGAIISYKRSTLLGALIIFFSSLIGQFVGGAIGFVLATPTWPTSFVSAIYNMDFGVSAWTLFSLSGSILLLWCLWRKRRRQKC